MSLTACTPQPVIRTETVTVKVPAYVALPDSLTAPVSVPELKDKPTNGDLAQYALECITELKKANVKFEAIQKAQPHN